MKPTAKERALMAQLDAIYARLPAIECRGGCAIACTMIPLTELEARRLQMATHRKPRTIVLQPANPDAVGRCVYLNAQDRCDAYAVRPLICRAYGLVRAMSCPRGCVPDRWLTDLEFLAIAQDVERLGGRLLMTDEQGVAALPADASFLRLRPDRPIEDIDADSERTRSLRALHGGRILAVNSAYRRRSDDDR